MTGWRVLEGDKKIQNGREERIFMRQFSLRVPRVAATPHRYSCIEEGLLRQKEKRSIHSFNSFSTSYTYTKGFQDNQQGEEDMAMASRMTNNQWWWLDSHTTTKRSHWLQSTLADLNEKTEAMLKLIEEDADSFAKRAEMFYKKRPELVSMVQDFYRTHRSLAEKYDQVKHDTGIGSGGSPFASAKYKLEKLMTFSEKSYDTYSDHCDLDECVESEVDDPEEEHEDEEGTEFHNCIKEEIIKGTNEEVMRLIDEIKRLSEENKVDKEQLKQKDRVCGEVMILREEIERLRAENEAQKEQLKEKDEEKIEVIRQLSLAINLLKEDNVKMRSFVAKESTKKWKFPFEFNKLGEALSIKLFHGTQRNQPGVELSRYGLQRS